MEVAVSHPKKWKTIAERHFKKGEWELFYMHHGWCLVRINKLELGGQILVGGSADRTMAKHQANRLIKQHESNARDSAGVSDRLREAYG